MTKNDKRLERLLGCPKDFHWDELVAVLEANGWTLHQSGGSHCFFVHSSGRRLNTCRPHPSGILKTYQIREVIKVLQEQEQGN